MDSPGDVAARAAARAGWPGLRTTRVSGCTTAEQRVAMVAELSAQAWALTGRPLPAYSRAEVPGRVRRLGQP